VTPFDVHWTPEAEADLEEIAYYIAVEERRPAVAEQIVRGIHRACEPYAATPSIGEAERRISEECRRFTYKRWVIFYRPIDRGIAVLRVVDGSRDFNRLFGAS
jgi:toxin ParE1/3/4